MPGNEVGDRIHNFLGQEGVSQGQHHSQVTDRAWPSLNNNLWVGNQRQIGGPLLSNLKNYNLQQLAESEREHGGQSLRLQHGLNFMQSSLRSEIAGGSSQNQSPIVNGYLQGHQTFQSRQSETNFLGVDTTSRSLSILESQMGNGPELHEKNSTSLESTESPVNYDFFGSQQQIGAQQLGMLQPLPRQQSGINDMHLLQQHVMLKQMQELHRQQLQKPRFQQHEASHLNPINQISSIAKQGSGNLSQVSVNGVLTHDVSSCSWQPELVMGSENWLQNGASTVMQGSSSGFMFSTEQGQAHLMGLIPQQVDQSLYGVPITGTRGNASQYSSVQVDKPSMQQVSATGNAFQGNQYAAPPDQGSLRDRTSVLKHGDQSRSIFGPDAGQAFNGGHNLETLQYMNPQQINSLMSEFNGRQEIASPSEASMEKSVIPASSSQNVTTLDPTEEKILFGSDDSVWDVFGKGSNMGSLLDATDTFGSFPSLQSGSWSALMQSAVAETSSSDVGIQEWNGLSLQNNEPPARNQQSSTVNDGSKKQSAWADNTVQTGSTLNSRSFTPADGHTNLNYSSFPGVQQLAVQATVRQTERLQNDSSQRFPQQSPEEQTKWLDRSLVKKPLDESSQHFGNISHSANSQSSMKSISGYHQSIASHNLGSQPYDKPNGWNFIGSASHGAGILSENQGNEGSLKHSQGSDKKSYIHEEKGHNSGPLKIDSISNMAGETGHMKSAMTSPQFYREGSNLKNAAAKTDSITTRFTKESSQQLSHGHNLNLWKSIDSTANSGLNRVSAEYQHQEDKSAHILESFENNFSDKGAVEAHELENSNIRENSNDSFRSNASQHSSGSSMREKVQLDGNDPDGGKQKSYSHVSWKPPVTRKFQYHPMGDLGVEVEPSYRIKHVAHAHSRPQDVSQLRGDNQNYVQAKFPAQVTGESFINGKGRFAGLQGDAKCFDGVPSKSMYPGCATATSIPLDRSYANHVPDKTTLMSQNVLELLQKVDQSKDSGIAAHLTSSQRNQSSEMADTKASDGSVDHLQQIQSSSSQGFGLQLGPPSQRSPILDHAFTSQSAAQTVCSLNTTAASSDIGRKAHNTWLGPTASVQSSNPHQTPTVEFKNTIPIMSGHIDNKVFQYNMNGAALTSGFPHSRSHLQNQNVTSVGGPVVSSESVKTPFSRSVSQGKQTDDLYERAQTSQSGMASVAHMPKGVLDNDLTSSTETSQPATNQNHERNPAPVLEAMSTSGPSVTPGSFPNAPQSCFLGSQPAKISQNLFKPQVHSNNNSETPLSGSQKLDGQLVQTVGNDPSEFDASYGKSRSFVAEEQSLRVKQVSQENDTSQKTPNALHVQQKESVVKSDGSSGLTTSRGEIEAFGHSLKPNNMIHQNLSLLHQVQAVKSIEIDPSNRSLKRFKGPDAGLNAQQVAALGGHQLSYGSNTVVRDEPVNHTLVPSGDSKMVDFSLNSGDNLEANASSDDMLAYGPKDIQKFSSNGSPAATRHEHTQVSPQMAPSWFDRYGTFKNGQMLPTYDTQKFAATMTLEKSLIVGRPSDSLHTLHSTQQVPAAAVTELDNVLQNSSSMSMASEHISTLCLPPPDNSNENLVVTRRKKRKSASSELLPWQREVSQGSPRLLSISVAEVEWARESNRLIEKVEDDVEWIEDWPPMLRSKRRLVLTTQLMQQLLHNAPRVVLSADASKNYESLAYFVARSALGDACSTTSISACDTNSHSDSRNISSEKHKLSERYSDQYILKALEGFISRSRKLENDILRLDKRASILDLRVECQELERVSVINRFARFHGRGQADGVESSLSSDGPVNIPKPFPQRYVTAFPIPRNLPDRVPCLSL
ncbi:hypothetical protein SLE2022_291490 [Rubroshorea leprosula]